MRNKIALVLVFCLMFGGCAMKAKKTVNTVTLSGFGSGKASFTDGTTIITIEKGLLNFPANMPIKLER